MEVRNEFGRTPLHYAANFKHVDIVKLLLERGADVNAKDTVMYMYMHMHSHTYTHTHTHAHTHAHTLTH
jgi:hypothetical protein